MRFCFMVVTGLMVVAWAMPVVVGQPTGPVGRPAGPGVTLNGFRSQPPMRVFRLERGDPEVVVLNLKKLLGDPDAEVVPPVPRQVPFNGGISGGGGGSFCGASGFSGAGSGISGFSGSGTGCFAGTGPAAPPPVWRAAAHPRTGAVVVRGSDRHLDVAADLVALLDLPAGAPLPKLKVVRAIPLKHSTAEELRAVLHALSFEGAGVAAPSERVLAVVAPDEATRSIAELVAELDVPDATGPKPKR